MNITFFKKFSQPEKANHTIGINKGYFLEVDFLRFFNTMQRLFEGSSVMSVKGKEVCICPIEENKKVNVGIKEGIIKIEYLKTILMTL